MSQKTTFFIAFWCFFHAFSARAQPSGAAHFKTLSTAEGLSENTNAFFFRDSRGFVWVSSLDGLNRFDGRRVRVFRPVAGDSTTLLDGNVQSQFFEDRRGDIWFGTVRGLHRYRWRKGMFERWVAPENAPVCQPFFFENERWLWLQTGETLCRFDVQNPSRAENWQPVAATKSVRFAVQTDGKGQPERIFGCFWENGQGFEILDLDEKGAIKSRRTFFAERGQPAAFSLKTTSVILEKNSARALLTTDRGLLFFDAEKPTAWRLFEKKKSVRAIMSLQNSTLLLFQKGEPTELFDPKKGISNQISTEQTAFFPFEEGQNHHGWQDSDGLLWLSRYGDGLRFFDFSKKLFAAVLEHEKPFGKKVFCLAEEQNGTVWALEKRGRVSKFSKEKTWLEDRKASGRDFIASHNNSPVFRFSSEGASLLSENTERMIAKSRDLNADDVCSDLNGGFFISDFSQILHFENSKSIKPILPKIEAPYLICSQPSNRLWVSFSDHLEVWKIAKSGLSEKAATVPINRFARQLLFDPTRQKVWAATADGLLEIDATTHAQRLFSKKEGLENAAINALCFDKNGKIWCGGNRGIARFDPETERFRCFSERDGIECGQIERGAALCNSVTGEIWMGGAHGLVVFHPDSLDFEGRAPQIALVGLQIHGQTWRGPLAIEAAERVSLEHFENTLTLEMAAMDYRDPAACRFRCRLDGHDREWAELGGQDFVSYVNLPSGRYLFRWMAASSDGTWSAEKTLEIEIKTPFFQSIWFKMGCVLAFFSLVFGFFRMRERQRLDRFRLRERISQDLHDDLGSALNSIALQSENAAVSGSEKMRETLFEIGSEAREVSSKVRDLVWTLRPESGQMPEILARMRGFAEPLLESKGIAFELKCDQKAASAELGIEERRHFFLFFKEAVNNAAKYSAAQKVAVEIAFFDKKMRLEIADDGLGFEPQKVRRGNGLKNLVERAEALGGRFSLFSELGKGTRAELVF